MSADQAADGRAAGRFAGWPSSIVDSVASAGSFGVPPASFALYGRWWQLETWLRTLIYLELRARYGHEWQARLDPRAGRRLGPEASRAYMRTADRTNPMAYLDTGTLFELIREEWELFEPSLLPQRVWEGRAEELLHIRHRIGHCRRPHRDDISRLEQTLRDLEPGAHIAISAFANSHPVSSATNDPVVEAWVHARHPDAARLIEHCRRQYETNFNLRFSARPWASSDPRALSPGSGTPGVLWEMWLLFRGARGIRAPARFWRSSAVQASVDSLVFVTMDEPWNLRVTFPAVDDPTAVSDAIGCCFDAAMEESSFIATDDIRDPGQWPAEPPDEDARLQVGTPLAIYDSSMAEASIFGAL